MVRATKYEREAVAFDEMQLPTADHDHLTSVQSMSRVHTNKPLTFKVRSLTFHDRVPSSVILELVGESVVLVVLDAPRLEGVQKRCKEEVAHNVFNSLVGVEASVATVVPNDEPASESCSRNEPSNWEEPGRGYMNEV